MKLKHAIGQKALGGIMQLLKWLNFTRLSAIITVTCFIFTSVFAQGVSAFIAPEKSTKVVSEALGSFEIPYSVGRITDAKSFSGSKIVVNIQDLHCHAEVQKNISRILSLLDEKYGLKKVYVEGAEGGLDTSWVNDIKNEKLRDDVVNSLLEGGRLNGPEYYSITSKKPKLLIGMENKKAYESNIARLNKIIEGKNGMNGGMMPVMKAEVDRVKELYLSQKNRRLEKLTAQYKAGDITAKKYYKLMTKITSESGININDYGNICKFLNILKMQQQLNYGKITNQLNRYLSQLKDKLPYKEYVLLQEKTKDLSRIDELYVVLSRITKGTDFERESGYNELKQFLEFVDANQKINPMTLVYEEKALINELLNRNAKSGSEREVIFLSYFTGLLQDYLDNKISAPDYTSFSSNMSKFTLLWKKYADPSKMIPLDEYSSLFESFYGTNVARNNYFFDNIFGKVPATKEAGDNSTETALLKLKSSSDITVIVAGGFHTPGFSKLLKDKGISYIVITPNVTEDTKLADNVYDQLAIEHAKILSQGLIWGQVVEIMKGLTPEQRIEYVQINQAAATLQRLTNEGRDAKGIIAALQEFLQAWKAETKQDVNFTQENGVYTLTVNGKQHGFKIVNNQVEIVDFSAEGTTLHFKALELKTEGRTDANAAIEIVKRRIKSTALKGVTVGISGVKDSQNHDINSFQMVRNEKERIMRAFDINEAEFAELLSQAFAKVEKWQSEGLAIDIDSIRSEDGIDRNGTKKDKITLALLEKNSSKHLFARDAGFIGISEELIAIAKINPKIAKSLFVAGVAHELRHEGGRVDESEYLDARHIANLLIDSDVEFNIFEESLKAIVVFNQFIEKVRDEFNKEFTNRTEQVKRDFASRLEGVSRLISGTFSGALGLRKTNELSVKYGIDEASVEKAVKEKNPDYISAKLNEYLNEETPNKDKIAQFMEVCSAPVEELYKTYTVQAAWPVTMAVQQLSLQNKGKLLDILSEYYTSGVYLSGEKPIPQLIVSVFMLQAKEDYKQSLLKKQKLEFRYGQKIYELIAKQLKGLEGRCVYTVSPEITSKAGGLGPVMEFLGGGENFILNNMGIHDASNATMELWYKYNSKGKLLDYELYRE